MSLAQRTVKGMIWAYTTFFGGRLVTLLTTAVLARVLIPEDFGLIGWALIMLNFIEGTGDFGIKDALIYTSERVEDAANTAFLMNLSIGALQFGVAFLLAPLSLHFIDDPRVVDVVRVMSLAFLFNGIGNTHDALLQKELKFRRRYVPQLYSAVIKGVVSIMLALLGFGVWSLAVGHVVGAVVRTVGRWMLLDWRPHWRFYGDRARALWGYGVYILLFDLLGIALDQADQLIIGTLLGGIQLGYYTVAARIPEMLILNFSLVLGKVIFPTYAKIKDDLEALKQGFLTTSKYTALVTVPAGLGLVAVAPELVEVAFGGQWGPAVPLFQVLALMAMVGTLYWSAGDVFKAVGRPDISTKLLLVESLFTFPLIWALGSGSRLAFMVSFGNLIAVCIGCTLRLWLVSRFLKFSPLTYVRVYRSAFVGAAIMFALVMGWRVVAADWPILVNLVTAILVGGVAYVVVLWLLEREEFFTAWGLLLGIVRRRPVAAEAGDV